MTDKYIECRNYVNCGEFVEGSNDFCENCIEERREIEVQFVKRDPAYFNSPYFDCSSEHLLTQIATRAEHWFKQVDGTYLIPKVGGQIEQIIEMAISAKLKQTPT